MRLFCRYSFVYRSSLVGTSVRAKGCLGQKCCTPELEDPERPHPKSHHTHCALPRRWRAKDVLGNTGLGCPAVGGIFSESLS